MRSSCLDLASADHLPLCVDLAEEDEEFMSELRPVDKIMYPDDDSDEVTDDEHEYNPVNLLRLKGRSKANIYLGDICDCLESRGYTSEAKSSKGLIHT